MTKAPLPARMKVVEISRHGPPDVLEPATRPLPEPGPGEVLIRVAAAGVNRPDCLQRRGLYPPPAGESDLPGLEVAGTIVALGRDTSHLRYGDKVCALVAGGGYAEYCKAPAGQCLPVPANMDMPHAAAMPEALFTVWSNLFDRGELEADEVVLVHGGASGIGTTAIQMAAAFGARVFATVGNNEKRHLAERLGAERAINYNDDAFVQVIQKLTDHRGVDVILDIVGGKYFHDNFELLAPEGRLVVIGVLGGTTAQELDLGRLLSRRLTITGSTLRARDRREKSDIASALREWVWPMLDAGEIAPVLQSTFPLEQAADAHRILEANEAMGKLVLTTGQ
jgi:putative PIG3 family NAD(P)H quinone oxidoreductase